MMNWFHKRFSRQLSAKLVTLILTLLILSILMISTFYYWSSTGIIRENVRASTEEAAKQSSHYLSLILTVGSDVGQQIFRDPNIQQVITDEARGILTVDQKYKMHETVNGILNNLMYTSSFIRSVYLLKEEGSSWGSGSLNFSKVKRYTLKEQQWYQEVVHDHVDDLWLPLHYNPFSGGGENTEVVMTLVKPFRNLQSGETLGVIMVNMSGNAILEAIQKIHLGKTGKFFVVDQEGVILIDRAPELWNATITDKSLREIIQQSSSLQTEMVIDGVPHYVVTHRLDNDWTIIGTVPVKEIIGELQRVQTIIWLFSIVLMVMASLIGVMFSRKITRPLKELMGQMENIEKSNFSGRAVVRSQDEIGQLGRRFNQMVYQIEQLIQQVNEEEEQKRVAELRALRYQINPHFLYNTLASIRWMIRFKKTEEAYRGIAALVQLMESSMEKQGIYSMIQEELEFLERFMIIQRLRYGEQIHLKIHCDPQLYSLQIPRMLLQPIVENAIFHGLAPKRNQGTITVHIALERYEFSMLTISIQDDGIGIEPGVLNKLLETSTKPHSGMFGIGLYHVHETIQLYYGASSGITIESEPQRGTTVTLKIKLKESED